MENNLINREHKSIFQTYSRLPIIVDRAVGCTIYDNEGNEYLDFLGGIAVNVLGHSHPLIIEAIKKQAEKYLHISNYFYQEPQVKLAEVLSEASGFSRVFFCNSGSEANEGAVKLARKWGTANNKNQIISFTGGFHGRTYGALSMMDKPLYMEGMGPYLANRTILPYNDINALEANINEDTNALVIEIIQGEGGLSIVTPEFVAKINELKAKYGFLLICDEVQSGVGRTGKFCAYQHFDIMPDIITLAKGIGGGIPLGCFMANDEVANVWTKGNHGTTFGGNALACAVGLVVLNELKSNLNKHILDISLYFDKKLHEIKAEFPKLILEVKGIGLMKGLLLSVEASEIVNELVKLKVITNSASGKVLRLLPPYIITEKDIDKFTEKLIECLHNFNLKN